MSRALLPAFALSLKAEIANGEPTTIVCDFGTLVTGRPGFLHGGAIGALLEAAGMLALLNDPSLAGRDVHPVPINIAVQYLRGAKAQRTRFRGEVTRSGRRHAHIAVAAWQDNPDIPVATALMNMLIAPD